MMIFIICTKHVSFTFWWLLSTCSMIVCFGLNLFWDGTNRLGARDTLMFGSATVKDLDLDLVLDLVVGSCCCCCYCSSTLLFSLTEQCLFPLKVSKHSSTARLAPATNSNILSCLHFFLLLSPHLLFLLEMIFLFGHVGY